MGFRFIGSKTEDQKNGRVHKSVEPSLGPSQPKTKGAVQSQILSPTPQAGCQWPLGHSAALVVGLGFFCVPSNTNFLISSKNCLIPSSFFLITSKTVEFTNKDSFLQFQYPLLFLECYCVAMICDHNMQCFQRSPNCFNGSRVRIRPPWRTSLRRWSQERPRPGTAAPWNATWRCVSGGK